MRGGSKLGHLATRSASHSVPLWEVEASVKLPTPRAMLRGVVDSGDAAVHHQPAEWQWVGVSFYTLPNHRGALGTADPVVHARGQWAVVSVRTLPQCKGARNS